MEESIKVAIEFYLPNTMCSQINVYRKCNLLWQMASCLMVFSLFSHTTWHNHIWPDIINFPNKLRRVGFLQMLLGIF